MTSITENLDAAAAEIRHGDATTVTFKIRDATANAYDARPALHAILHRSGFAEILDEQAGPLTPDEDAEYRAWRAQNPEGVA